jgi:hypothetical protein
VGTCCSCAVPGAAAGDMDDLLELLFPDDPQLGAAHLADMEPAALRAHLATRGELQTASGTALAFVGQLLCPSPCDSSTFIARLKEYVF